MGSSITRRDAAKFVAGLCLAGYAAKGAATQQTAFSSIADLPDWAQRQTAYRRMALLIGLGSYVHVESLPTPPADIALMSAALNRLGFDDVQTQSGTSFDACRLRAAIDGFTATLAPGDLALIYFSGHGVSRNGLNYLVPSTARPVSGQMAGYEYVSLDYVQQSAAASRAGLTLIFIDACRNDPFSGQAVEDVAGDDDAPESVRNPLACPLAAADEASPASDGSSYAPLVPNDAAVPTTGLAPLSDVPSSIFVGFASEPNSPAETLLPGEEAVKGSLYTRALSEALQPSCSLGWMMDETKGRLSDLSTTQRPWFTANTGGTVMLSEDARFREFETETWIGAIRRSRVGPNSIRTPQQQEASELRNFLSHFPIGRFSGTARNRLLANQSHSDPDPQSSAASPVEMLFTGSVLSPSAFAYSTEAGASIVNNGQQLFSKPVRSRNKGIISSLQAGAAVRIQKMLPGNWALVETDGGLQGFLPDVVSHKLAGKTATLLYTGDQPDAGHGDEKAVRELATDAIEDNDAIVISVGMPAGGDSGLAARTAYLRSLRLSEEIEALGLPSDRITLISGAASGVPANQAKVTLVRV